MDRGSAMVDTKGIGQLFTLKGTSDQDFGEWTHKVRTFMLPRFGDDILTALTWEAQQQRIIVKTCVASQRNRMISWNTLFGDQAGEDEIENIDDFVGKLYDYLYPLQPTHLTELSQILEKEMVWKRGADCTASSTRHHT